MRRLILPLTLAVLALPAEASAAPAKISPRAGAVAASGTTAVQVANSGRSVLTGRATITVAGDTVASRAVRLPGRSVTTVRLRLATPALAALRAAGTQRATVAVRLRRAGGRASTVRRTVTLRAASAQPTAPAPAAPAPGTPAPGAPAPGAPGTAPAPSTAPPAPAPAVPAAPSNRWVGRMGAEGAYDDLELALVDGGFQITKAPAVPVYCFETGGRPNNSWASGELFDAPGPWTIGTDGEVVKEGIAVNPLVGRSPRTITYKVTGTSREAGRITGTLAMTFFGARPHVFYGSMVIINCFGSESFEAVPAG
jgi:hypothetical protein